MISKVSVLLVLTLISKSIQNVEDSSYQGNSTNKENTITQEDSLDSVPCTSQDTKSPYLAQIFNKYGHQGKIDLEGFEKLFSHLEDNHHIMRHIKNQDEIVKNVRNLNEDLSKSSHLDGGKRGDGPTYSSDKVPMQTSDQAVNQTSNDSPSQDDDSDVDKMSRNERLPRHITVKKHRHVHNKHIEAKRQRYRKHSHPTEKQHLDTTSKEKYRFDIYQSEGLSSKTYAKSFHKSDVPSNENREKISKSQNTRHSKIPMRHRKHSDRSMTSSIHYPLRHKRQALGPTDENSKRETTSNEKQCLSPASFLKAQNLTRGSNLTSSDFLKLCPALLYLIDRKSCLEAPPCVGDKQHDLITNIGGVYGDSHGKDEHSLEHDNHSESHDHDHDHDHQNETDHDHHHENGHDHDHDHQHETGRDHNIHEDNKPSHDKTWKSWVYAILFVCVISLLSLMGIFIVPCSQRKWYPYVQHFMLGLSVGSLVGDSLLHIIPLVLNSETLYGKHDSHGNESHTNDSGSHESHDDTSDHHGHYHTDLDVWKGFVIFCGVYVFYLLERSMEFLTKKKSDTNMQKRESSGHVKALNYVQKENAAKGQAGVTLSSEKAEETFESSNGKSLSGPDQADVNSISKNNHGNQTTTLMSNQEGGRQASKGTDVDGNQRQQPSAKLQSDGEYEDSSVRELVSPAKKESLKGINLFNHSEELVEERSSEQVPAGERTKSMSLNDLSTEKKHKKSSLFNSFNIHKIESQGSHMKLTKEPSRHQNSHFYPSRTSSAAKPVITSAAWVVVIGDAFHNLCDGLAIGSTFSYSIRSGLSTGLAVFMHELPHELGDFAMLLRSGMSIKKALFYNFVSSLTCLVGTVIGLALGQTTGLTNWLVPAVAGIFIYIALVDMLPELTIRSRHDPGKPYILLLWQNIGIWFGVSMMLLIALYEDLIHV